MPTTYGTIQFRRSTAAQATADNVVLNVGEPGYETDTGKLKIGDGSTAWNSLQYAFVQPADASNGASAFRQALDPVYNATLGPGGTAGNFGLTQSEAAAAALLTKPSNLQPVTAPTGFSWANHPLVGKLFVDQYGHYSTTLDITSYKNALATTLWVDIASGADSNPGTQAAPFQSIHAAMTALKNAGGGTLMVKGYGVSQPYYRQMGFNGANQALNVNIIGYGGTPYITTADSLTFTLSSGMTNTYQAARSTVQNVVDVIGGVAPGKLLTNVTSIALVEATVGSWYTDGTTLYVHAVDSRNLATTGASAIWATLAAHNFWNMGDYTTYLENLVLYGGTNPVHAEGVTAAGCFLAMNAVETRLSQATQNNVGLLGGDAVLFNCETAWSAADGYNYHAENGHIPHIIEIGCRSHDCGHTGGDQCSTSHDGTQSIRVSGTYRRAAAQTIADVSNGTQAWLLGCVLDGAGDSFANYQAGLISDTGATGVQAWLEGCDTANATYGAQAFGDGAQIFNRGSRIERPGSPVLTY